MKREAAMTGGPGRKPSRLWTCVWWGSLVGLAVTLAAAVVSEVSGFYYNEAARSPGNFFMLDRSSVWLTVMTGRDPSIFTGIPLYQDGWNRTGAIHRAFTKRTWWPSVRSMPLGMQHVVAVRLPLWTPAVLLGGVLAVLWRQRQSRPAWACGGCGYDLRGSGGGVCPECGSPAAQSG